MNFSLRHLLRRKRDEAPLIVHVHVPKAGGMALAQVLRTVYGDKLLVAHPELGWPQVWPKAFLDDVAEKRNFYKAFSGHSAYGIHEVFGRRALYFSSVRDPVERYESYYNFVCHWKIHHHYEAAQTRSIGEFYRYLRDRDDIELFNLQCQLLCGSKDYAKAREFVRTSYTGIIPMKYFGTSIGYLAQKLDWPTVAEPPRLNVTTHKARVSEMTEADLRALREGNSQDRDLVKFCEDNLGNWFQQHH